MKTSIFYKCFGMSLTIFAFLFVCNSSASAQRGKPVTVKFEVGIYRDWDKSWMTTAPDDVVAKITTSKGSFDKTPDTKNIVIFTNVPCGESVKINIRFVGTASYKASSRNYTKTISCDKPTVNLGRLEYGTW